MKRLDRLMDAAAHRVLAWSARHAEPARAPWIDALRGELELVDGGAARLVWALGGLSVVCRSRRSTVSHIWRSLPAALRFSVFGLALGVAGVIDVVWSNVIVPSHESDSEYQGLYLVLLATLLLYFAASGFVAASLGSSMLEATLTGLVTASVGIGIALMTFVVIDNLFLDVVMQQPDKAYGFAHSGLRSARDYVNQNILLGIVTAMPMAAALGAACGVAGGLLGCVVRPRRAAAV